MTTLRTFWRNRTKKEGQVEVVPAEAGAAEVDQTAGAQAETAAFDLDIAANDPFLTYCLNSKGVIDRGQAAA